jgi:hypothetical protein
MQCEGEEKVQMETEPDQVIYEWFYYEHETKLDQLCERLNTKGIRERRL